MGLGTKYFTQDIKHFKEMIEVDRGLIEVVKMKMAEFPANDTIQQLGQEQIERSEENITYYQERITNLIEKGDSDG